MFSPPSGNSLLHQDPYLSQSLELILGFLRMISGKNKSNKNSSSINFWSKLGVKCSNRNQYNACSSSLKNFSECLSSSSSSFESIFVVLKVIETLIENYHFHHRDNNQNQNSSTVITQRDIYYSFVQLLPRRGDQTIVNRAIERVCQFCNNCPRHFLGVYTSTRGFVAGSLILGTSKNNNNNNNDDDEQDENNTSTQISINLASLSGNQGFAIPGEFASLPEWIYENNSNQRIPPLSFQSSARCILVVEKDSVFQHLVGQRIWTRYPMIIITGRGFPDVATKVFLSRLSLWLGPSVPIYGLVDYNPAGARILFVYKFGNLKQQQQQQQFESNNNDQDEQDDCDNNSNNNNKINMFCPNLKWLGARHDDLELIHATRNHQNNFLGIHQPRSKQQQTENDDDDDNDDDDVEKSSSNNNNNNIDSVMSMTTSQFNSRDSTLASSLKRDIQNQITTYTKKQFNVNSSTSSVELISSLELWNEEVTKMKSSSTRFDLESIPGDLCQYVLNKIVRGDAI